MTRIRAKARGSLAGAQSPCRSNSETRTRACRQWDRHPLLKSFGARLPNQLPRPRPKGCTRPIISSVQQSPRTPNIQERCEMLDATGCGSLVRSSCGESACNLWITNLWLWTACGCSAHKRTEVRFWHGASIRPQCRSSDQGARGGFSLLRPSGQAEWPAEASYARIPSGGQQLNHPAQSQCCRRQSVRYLGRLISRDKHSS